MVRLNGLLMTALAVIFCNHCLPPFLSGQCTSSLFDAANITPYSLTVNTSCGCFPLPGKVILKHVAFKPVSVFLDNDCHYAKIFMTPPVASVAGSPWPRVIGVGADFFLDQFVKTNVYVDGFNLYYRAVKGTPYKWLDLSRLCGVLLPSHSVNRIRYFTALVDSRAVDPQSPIRQQTYIRALTTITNLSVHYGQFRTRKKRTPLVSPGDGIGAIVEVWDTEEKGSDVNLATYLLIDAFNQDYEQAVIISNDSDLAFPIRVVRAIPPPCWNS